MVKVYVSLIRKGKMKIEDVPMKWRKQVRAELKK